MAFVAKALPGVGENSISSAVPRTSEHLESRRRAKLEGFALSFLRGIVFENSRDSLGALRRVVVRIVWAVPWTEWPRYPVHCPSLLTMMTSKQIGHELYVWHNGQLVYKRWTNKSGKKTQPSLLFNVNGWPNEWIY